MLDKTDNSPQVELRRNLDAIPWDTFRLWTDVLKTNY